MGGGDLDWSALALAVRKDAGLQLSHLGLTNLLRGCLQHLKAQMMRCKQAHICRLFLLQFKF